MGKRIHGWGPWEEHIPTNMHGDHYRYMYRKCLDCGQYQHAEYRTLCDIR